MRAIVLIGRWVLVALSVVAWILVVPLVDLVARRFGREVQTTWRPRGVRRKRDLDRAA
jgi:hypothetical protein